MIPDPLQAIFYWIWNIEQCREDHTHEFGPTLGELDSGVEIHRLVGEWKEQRG